MTGPSPGRLVVVAAADGTTPSARALAVLAAADEAWGEEDGPGAAWLDQAGVAAGRRHRLDPATDPTSIVAAVAAGRTVVLLTGASGASATAPVVGAVVDAGLLVEVVPAPVAAVAALVASGLPTDRVVVDGPLPPPGQARTARLAALGVERRTTAVPVAEGELAAALADVAAGCGPDRPVAVAVAIAGAGRSIWRGRAGDAAARPTTEAEAGSVVLVVGGAPEGEAVADHGDEAVRAALRAARARGLAPGRAAAEVAAALGRPRREVYALGAIESEDDHGGGT